MKEVKQIRPYYGHMDVLEYIQKDKNKTGSRRGGEENNAK